MSPNRDNNDNVELLDLFVVEYIALVVAFRHFELELTASQH